MGVSFKVSKTGTRFRPKPIPNDTAAVAAQSQDDVVLLDSSAKDSLRFRRLPNNNSNESASASTRKRAPAEISEGDEDSAGLSDCEVSFTLSLFPDGYTIGKPSEGESGHLTSAEVPKFLHPYDRASESLFSAIESGRLPGDILDGIPCKYINGMLVCELRDYRKCFSEAGANMPSAGGAPIVDKVCLRMSLENVVKDIPSISDSAWTYGDLMEVESRILKALQPKLSLDPTPKLDRLSDKPIPTKLNLAMYSMRRKRLRQIPEVTVISNNNIHGKKVCIDRVPESSRLGDSGVMLSQNALENLHAKNNVPNSMLVQRANSFGSNASGPTSPMVAHPSKYQMGVGSPRLLQDQRSGAIFNASGASVGQDMMINYSENMNSGAVSFHGKRDSQEAQCSPISGSNKRSRVTSMGINGNQPQNVGSQVEGFHGPDSVEEHTVTAVITGQRNPVY